MAYRADIEIAVRGAQELKRLQNEIKSSSDAVNSLNSSLNAVANLLPRSFANLNKVVGEAADNFNRVALGTQEATEAARVYARATDELNVGLQERAALLKQIIEQERKAKLAAAGVRETTQYGGPIGPGQASPVALSSQLRGRTQQILDERKGVNELAEALLQLEERRRQETNAALDARAASVALQQERKQEAFLAGKTQFAEPIGPGQASPIGALVGQKSPVAERLQRTVQSRQDELALQQALLRLEEKSAAELNKKVQSQEALVQGTREVLALIEQQNRRQQFLAGKSGTAMQGPLAGPGAMGFPVALPLSAAEQKGLEIETKKQQILQRMADTRQQLVGLASNLQRLDQNSAVAIADAERAQTKLNAAKERELQISKQGALLAGNFSPIGGAADIPGSPAAIAAAQSRRREAASNAIIGGAFPLLFGQGAGAAVGGGLGGALGGLAGGQSLVGTALGQTFDNATQSAADFTKALKDTGDASAVLETALGRVDKTTKITIQNLAKSGQQAAAAEASFQALAAEIGTEQAEAFRRAGEATTEWGSNLQKWLTKTYANVILLGEAIKNNFPTGPGIQAQTSVFDIVEAQPQQALTQEARDRLEDLAGQNSLLEKQVALTRLTADASVDQRLQLERQIALQAYVNDATELERQLKQKLLSDQEYNLRLKAAELRFTQQLFEVENAAQQARQRKAEEAQRAAEKAQRDAERAAQKQLQTLNNIRNLQVSLIQQTLESADIDIARTRAVDGEIAALKEATSQLQARLNIEARILDIQLEQQLSAQDITDQERTLYESIYKQQRANLEAQYEIKARTQQLDLARLQTARQILFAEGGRAVEDIRQQRGTQLAGLQAELAFPFGGDGLDVANQQLEQQTRRYETLIPLQRELQNLETDRANIAATASAQELQDLNKRITDKITEIELQGQYLTQLDATEQALLRQQQIYAKYGFIADEVSRALSDSITGLITGTTTVTEAFSRMFENIGKAFIDMATQMLAQQLFMTVLRAFAGGGSSSIVQGTNVPISAMPAGMAFAEGGFVTGPTNALIGEGGEPEYVIPASKMRTAMGRYAGGARGAAVIPGNGESGGGGMGAAPSGTIDVRYSIERINNVDYVTADQFQRGMAQAAQQGAIQGERRAMRSLKNSAATRRGVGI